MKTVKKALLVSVVAVALGSAMVVKTSAANQNDDKECQHHRGHEKGNMAGSGHGRQRGQGRHGHDKDNMAGSGHDRQHGKRNGMKALKAFDNNNDGEITQAEVEQVQQARLAKFDTDGDGKLSLEEYQALWVDDMREHMADRFQELDNDGDTVVSSDEFMGRWQNMVSHLDQNDDGVISADELRQRRRHHKQ